MKKRSCSLNIMAAVSMRSVADKCQIAPRTGSLNYFAGFLPGIYQMERIYRSKRAGKKKKDKGLSNE